MYWYMTCTYVYVCDIAHKNLLLYHYVCAMCASIMEGQLKPSQTLTCLQISSLEATRRALLKINAIVKATGKNTTKLLGILDQIDLEI